MRRSIVPVLVLLLLLVASCGSRPADVAAPDASRSIAVQTAAAPTTASNDALSSPPPPAAPRSSSAPSTTRLEVATSAVATTPATRIVPTPEGECEQIATRLASGRTAVTQFVIVRTGAATDTTAILQLADRSGLGWTCGPEMVARVGRAGVRPLLDRRSGDGTTPAGVFPLATMTAWDGRQYSFFGNSPDPGVVAGTYRRTVIGDCFGATPNAPGYGHLRYDTRCPGPDDEYLPAIGAYTNAALIGANMEPDVSGDAPGEIPYASAIFLHRFSYATPGVTSGATKPTSGCVSLAQPDLTSVLVQLRSDVHFAIGTTDWLLAGAHG